MQEESTDSSLPISASIQLEPSQLNIVSGEAAQVKIVLTNQSSQEDYFDLALNGLPVGWLSFSALSLHLGAGEHQELLLKIHIPETPVVQAGGYPFTVRLGGQKSPGQAVEAQGSLVIGDLVGSTQVGLMLQPSQITLQPGEQAFLTIQLINMGSNEDTFRVSLSGVPIHWLNESIVSMRLAPGAQAAHSIEIYPPKSPESRAGRHTLVVQVFSGQSAEELARSDCTLTIASFEQFDSALEPKQFESGQKAQLTLHNQGNLPGSYPIAIENDANLIIKPAAAATLRLQPGETGQYEFTIQPAQKPLKGLFGRDSHLPFTVEVQSSDGEIQSHTGEVISRAPVPAWIWLVMLAIGLLLICMALYVMILPRIKVDQQATEQMKSARQTAQSIIAYQTALAITTASLFPIVPTVIPPSETPTSLPTFTATFIPPTYTPLPTVTPLPPTATPTVTPIPFPVPNLGSIAFESNRDGPRNLYAFNTAIQATSRLTINTWVDTMPAWSPSGQWIAFASNRTGNYDIFVMKPDGSAITNLTNSIGDDYSPTWSPDGVWIAFTSSRDGNQEIYKIRADGSETQNLTNNPSEDYYPSWLKFGQITFTTNRDGNQEIYLMDSNGAYPSNLTNSPANDFYPTGSHNGIWIAFASNRDGNQEIYMMNPDGSNPVNLTNNFAEDNQPCWSPDDAWIAFVTNRTGSPEIFIMRSNGTEPYNITNQPGQEQYPAWN